MGTAEDVFNWFEGRAKGGPQYKGVEYGSTQYVIDFDGTIWEMIPPSEMSYNCGADEYTETARRLLSNYPNDCTIGIEHTTRTWAGEYTPETVEASRILRQVIANKERVPVYQFTHDHIVSGGWDCPRNPEKLGYSVPVEITENPTAYCQKEVYGEDAQAVIKPGEAVILDLDFKNNMILLASNCQPVGKAWVPAEIVDFWGKE